MGGDMNWSDRQEIKEAVKEALDEYRRDQADCSECMMYRDMYNYCASCGKDMREE